MITPRVAMTQLAYIVRPGGLEDALDHWIKVMGAGPFFVGSFTLTDQVFRGRPTDMTCEVAVGYHGDVQIELINPTNDAPSPYREWLDKQAFVPRGGVYHHVMLEQNDFDASYARHLANGCTEAFLAIAPGGGRIAYLDAQASIGGYIELIESPGWTAMCLEMREITRHWQGEAPIRGFDTLTASVT